MTLRIALVGAGGVARRHVDVLHGLGGARVVSVTDALAPAADALATELDAVTFTYDHTTHLVTTEITGAGG